MGVMTGSLATLGSFDQCLSVHHDEGDGDPIVGRYCTLNIQFPGLPRPFKNSSELIKDPESFMHWVYNYGKWIKYFPIRIGVCLPSHCEKEDLEKLGRHERLKTLEELNTDVPFTAIENFLPVDTFFFISGLLIVYSNWPRIEKKKGKLNVLSSLFQRFWRMTPSYLLVLGSFSILPLLGSGPLWHEVMTPLMNNCANSWWSNLLYVSNYLPYDKMPTLWLGWVCALLCGLVSLWGVYPFRAGFDVHPALVSCYAALHRTIWCAAVAWLVVACHVGHGGLINTTLAWNGLVPLSTLSYLIYLIHPLVIYMHVATAREIVNLDQFSMCYSFLGHTAVSVLLAYVAHVTVELPFATVKGLLMQRRRASLSLAAKGRQAPLQAIVCGAVAVNGHRPTAAPQPGFGHVTCNA
ncbi:hypothetical protein V5799_025795 [Amblyomma americanum]|uniref:Nose resistant-to-fluoxetine protein N-terminal domain-containing protein n=1 Tax=Amblyomma americanum TaxID=6943 RepID=A0AAQ4E896_AMBAM